MPNKYYLLSEQNPNDSNLKLISFAYQLASRKFFIKDKVDEFFEYVYSLEKSELKNNLCKKIYDYTCERLSLEELLLCKN